MACMRIKLQIYTIVCLLCVEELQHVRSRRFAKVCLHEVLNQSVHIRIDVSCQLRLQIHLQFRPVRCVCFARALVVNTRYACRRIRLIYEFFGGLRYILAFVKGVVAPSSLRILFYLLRADAPRANHR